MRALYNDRIALGESHACFVHANGELYCWGLNDMGQLGRDPNVVPFSATPLLVPLPTRAVSVATGLDFTCVVDEIGDIYCFGNRAYGRLGGGTRSRGPEPSPVPQRVVFSGDFVQVAAGSAHACGLRATGVLLCWGWNAWGQAGGSAAYQLTPRAVSTGNRFVDVTAGANFTCGLLSDRHVTCWGANNAGQLGDGTLVRRSYGIFVREQLVGGGTLELEYVVQVEAGFAHACAIKVDGRVFCWGQGTKGQLGDGNQRVASTLALQNGITQAVSLGSGNRADHTCVLRADGNTFCWGRNDHGQIGNAAISPQVNPPVGPFLGNGAVELSAGANGTCAALASGEVRCWGFNEFGEAGTGNFNTNLTVPKAVVGLPAAPVSSGSVALGGVHSCALRSNGVSSCWGLNSEGQLGDKTITSHSAPATLVDYTGFGQGWFAKDLAAGRNFSCAVMSYGSVRCWGENTSGQLGDGTTKAALSGVAAVGTDGATGVAAGDAHACALLADGTIRCWGSNSDGQIGDFSVFDRPTPVRAYADHAYKIVAGQWHTCALTWTGLVECWGRGFYGQLGNGGTAEERGSTFVLTRAKVRGGVARLSGVIDIAAADSSTCALRNDGSVWCWGRGIEGQLGNGTTATRSTVAVPIDISTTGPIVEIAGGGNEMCAVAVVGIPMCWGSDAYGQLGDGAQVDQSVPTEVSASALHVRTLHVDVGFRHACASGVDGSLRCWGFNLFGQVGIGLNTGFELLPASVSNFP